jgi:hypothetical protein
LRNKTGYSVALYTRLPAIDICPKFSHAFRRLGIRLQVFVAIPSSVTCPARRAHQILDIVGRVDCSLPQLHSMIVKVALNMIRVVNIFHHVSVNGPVNHFLLRWPPPLSARRWQRLSQPFAFFASLFTLSLCAYQPFR